MTAAPIFIPSPNADDRPADAAIDHLVLHYTGMRSAEAAIGRLCDGEAAVSSHYVVDEDGTVYQLVEEQRRAFHAGVSFWRAMRQLNGRSIGIEIVNPGHEFGYRPFPEPQVAAVIGLCRGILARHPIPARNVVGHSDIAPDRKQDPGELFPWPRLAAAGIGLWTEAACAPAPDVIGALAAIGYDTSFPAETVITAFQRHFLPGCLSGQPDVPTARRAAAVRALVDATG